MRRFAVVAIMLLIPACAKQPPPKPVTHHLSIDLTISNRAIPFSGEYNHGCNLNEPFADLEEGADVVVKDARSTIVATGTLPAGDEDGNDCNKHVSLTVPDSSFYTIEMGKRPPKHLSRTELQAKGWHVALRVA